MRILCSRVVIGASIWIDARLPGRPERMRFEAGGRHRSAGKWQHVSEEEKSKVESRYMDRKKNAQKNKQPTPKTISRIAAESNERPLGIRDEHVFALTRIRQRQGGVPCPRIAQERLHAH